MTWLEEERQDRVGLRAELAAFRHDMLAMETRLSVRIAEVKSDLMKWSFVFWSSAVAAIAVLAGVFRN